MFFTRASDPDCVKEREYCVAPRIKTSYVDTCIVVAAPVAEGVFAIHLSMMEGGTWFKQIDAYQVEQIMRNNGAVDGVLFGQYQVWRQTPTVSQVFVNLCKRLGLLDWRERKGIIEVTAAELA